MGWKEGEGLGKNRQGMSAPLMMQVRSLFSHSLAGAQLHGLGGLLLGGFYKQSHRMGQVLLEGGMSVFMHPCRRYHVVCSTHHWAQTWRQRVPLAASPAQKAGMHSRQLT